MFLLPYSALWKRAHVDKIDSVAIVSPFANKVYSTYTIPMFDFDKKEKDIFKSLSVEALILFGSQAQKRAGPMSDFDIGVIFKKNPQPSLTKNEIYLALYGILEKHINQLVNIDIVFLEDAPSELRAHVMKYGVVIFESGPHIFADFKAFVMEQCSDFAPLQHIFHKGILSRIT